jgi:hypothetical protein
MVSQSVYLLRIENQTKIAHKMLINKRLKHGYVKRVVGWPYSSFHRYVAKGIYLANWCGDVDVPVGGDV